VKFTLKNERSGGREKRRVCRNGFSNSRKPKPHHKYLPWSHRHPLCLHSLCYKTTRSKGTADTGLTSSGAWARSTNTQRSPSPARCPANCGNVSSKQNPRSNRPLARWLLRGRRRQAGVPVGFPPPGPQPYVRQPLARPRRFTPSRCHITAAAAPPRQAGAPSPGPAGTAAPPGPHRRARAPSLPRDSPLPPGTLSNPTPLPSTAAQPGPTGPDHRRSPPGPPEAAIPIDAESVMASRPPRAATRRWVSPWWRMAVDSPGRGGYSNGGSSSPVPLASAERAEENGDVNRPLLIQRRRPGGGTCAPGTQGA